MPISTSLATAALVWVPVGGLTFWGLQQATTVPSAPERTCTAEVVVLEDASWLGTSLVLDGKQVAARWEVAGPELQGQVIDGIAYTAFPATWHGVPCTQVMP